MITIFISMFIFAFIGSISPGPVNIIATGTGANFGFRKALPHVMGATIAYTLIVFLVGIGLNKVLDTYPQITNTLKYLGGGFLIYMSFKIASSKPLKEVSITVKKAPTLLEGGLSQGLNPKAWLVSMSGVSLFVAANSPVSLYLMVFCTISFIVCFFGVGTWAAIGHVIHKHLSNEKHQIIFNMTMGLLLSSTVVVIFLNS